MQERNDYRSRARVNNPYAQQDDAPTYSGSYNVPSTTNLISTGGGGRGDVARELEVVHTPPVRRAECDGAEEREGGADEERGAGEH